MIGFNSSKTLFSTLAIWGLTGCSTTSLIEIAPVVMTPEEFSKLDVPQQQSSLEENFKKAWEQANKKPGEQQTPRKLLPQFTRHEADAALRFLCNGPKPKRAVSHQFKFVLPKPPSGLPLNKAAEISDRFRSWMNAYVAGFYRLLAFGRVDERFQMVGNYERVDAVPGPFPYLMANPEKNPEELIYRFKGYRLKTTSVPYDDVIERMMTGSGDPVTPVLFKVGPKNQFLATFLDTSVFGKPDPGTDLVPAFEGFKEIFPFDLWAIRENYILAVSEKEATAWQGVAGKRWRGDMRVSLNQEVVEGPAMSHEILVEQRNQIWTQYFLANAAIKEGSIDGQVVAFKVTLNTEPLCRMARQEQDFFSQ